MKKQYSQQDSEFEHLDFKALEKIDIFEYLKEYGRTISKNQADLTIKGIKEIISCKEECIIKATEVYKWLGFIKIRGRHFPATYIIIAIMAIIGFLLGFYNLIK